MAIDNAGDQPVEVALDGGAATPVPAHAVVKIAVGTGHHQFVARRGGAELEHVDFDVADGPQMWKVYDVGGLARYTYDHESYSNLPQWGAKAPALAEAHTGEKLFTVRDGTPAGIDEPFPDSIVVKTEGPIASPAASGLRTQLCHVRADGSSGCRAQVSER
ncbi:MAG TPA: hypothetical protein VL172_15695 [Kofleriaceae bacterium]|nr:hypothetical protein [Kofleriaceae bacterium]